MTVESSCCYKGVWLLPTTMSDTMDGEAGGFADRTSSGRRVVDWVITGLLIVLGLVVSAGGGVLVGVADRELFHELIEDEPIDSDLITHAELGDLIFAFAWWGGTGTVIAGIALILAGVLFGIGRHRIDQLEPGSETPTFVANALLGGVVTVFLSVIPFSGALGGGIAGYLETDDAWEGALVGGTAAFFPLLPLLIILLTIFIGVIVEGLAIFGLFMILVGFVSGAISVAIGAVGGAAGAYLRDRD